MNLGASPEPCSAASGWELYPTFSSAEAGREGGLKILHNLFTPKNSLETEFFAEGRK